MKKWIITLLFVISSFLSFGQERPKSVLKFLGIPVDGTKQQMITALQKKGFKYNSYAGVLFGVFNGDDVAVMINTNHNKVDRVYVRFSNTDADDIKFEFNYLLSQFEDNPKYKALGINNSIPEDEDVALKTLLDKKHYEASFYYFDPELGQDYYFNALKDKLVPIMGEDHYDGFMEQTKKLRAFTTSDNNEHLFDNYDSFQTIYPYLGTVIEALQEVSGGNVWFTIHNERNKYFIGLYYDNLHNRPHGEDL